MKILSQKSPPTVFKAQPRAPNPSTASEVRHGVGLKASGKTLYPLNKDGETSVPTRRPAWLERVTDQRSRAGEPQATRKRVGDLLQAPLAHTPVGERRPVVEAAVHILDPGTQTTTENLRASVTVLARATGQEVEPRASDAAAAQKPPVDAQTQKQLDRWKPQIAALNATFSGFEGASPRQQDDMRSAAYELGRSIARELQPPGLNASLSAPMGQESAMKLVNEHQLATELAHPDALQAFKYGINPNWR